MFAVIRTGGKQYKVKAGDRIEIEKMEAKQGDKVELGDVLLTSKGAASGVKVIAEVLKQFRDEKVVIFKKRRRHNYRRKKGHRQYLTQVEIKEIKA